MRHQRGSAMYRSCCSLLICTAICLSLSEGGSLSPANLGHNNIEASKNQVTALKAHRSRRHAAGGYFLTACAQFKDEDGILVEWLDHYLAEGVEHFFLIDDGSSDSSHSVLEPYIHKHLVTLMVDVRKDHDPPISMTDRYNLLFKPFHYLTAWMIHIDLDEFVYARQTSLASFLRRVEPTIGEIRVPWKQFGSSGHVQKPEKTLVASLLHRAAFQVNISMYLHTKSIFRVTALVREDVHHARLKPGFTSGFALMDSSVAPELPGWPLNTIEMPDWEGLSDEDILDQLGIHLNHYATRYKDWFMAVKATRGIADREVNLYDEGYFIANDRNEVLDQELAAKPHHGVRTLSGGQPSQSLHLFQQGRT